MRILCLGGYAVSIGAAALLAGCGGSQSRIGGPGAIPESSAMSGRNSDSPFIAAKGALFGTTTEGGTHGGGTVFEIDLGGQERVVHNFGRKADGVRPTDRLIYADGNLYGTTMYGGEHNLGTVFAIAKSGRETILHSFSGSPADGAYPSAPLLDVRGKLYGTTLAGGEHNWGPSSRYPRPARKAYFTVSGSPPMA